MTPSFHCLDCGIDLGKMPRVLCADYAWRCYRCAAPLVHPKHEKDAGVTIRVALVVACIVGLLVLAVLRGYGGAR